MVERDRKEWERRAAAEKVMWESKQAEKDF